MEEHRLSKAPVGGSSPFNPINIKNAVGLCEDYVYAIRYLRCVQKMPKNLRVHHSFTSAVLQLSLAKEVLEQYLRSLQN